MLEKIHALYICYFGLREPLVQTQVLPYLREIKKIKGLKVSLLTFEPNFKQDWTKEQVDEQKKQFMDEDINWFCLPYHKSPSVPATFYDILSGSWFVWQMMRHEKIDLLHARIHIPALMCLIAKKFSFYKPKLLFDIRGFFPEEYIDADVWKKDSFIYRAVKRIEKWILKESDGFVVLTEKARFILFPESIESGVDKFGRPVEVIPCCVDMNRFQNANLTSRNKIRKLLNINDRKVIVYLGSFGGWYLTDEIINFFVAARGQDDKAFALILTQRDTEAIVEKLKKRGLSNNDFWVSSISPSEVPLYLSAADIALSFIKPSYSKKSSSPTKIAEYLISGLPVVANAGVGDIDNLILKEKVGVLIEDLNDESFKRALEQINTLINDPNLSDKCRICANDNFSLNKVGGAKYRSIYKALLFENEQDQSG